MAGRWSLKRVLLYSVIGALALCALLGIYCFLFGQFGETEAKILATTVGVCFYSLTAMACFAVLERRRSAVLAIPGLGTCAAGMLVLLGVVWLEGYKDEVAMKTAAVLAMFAVSFAQASLLSLAQLERKLAWLSWIAYGAIFWLVIQLSVMLVGEIDDEWLVRLAGALGILDGCASLTIPILYKLRGGPQPAAVEPAYTHVELTCPRCGRQGKLPVGAVKCSECSLRMRIEVREMPETVTNPPFQFSLRSLMLVTLIAAVGLSIFATRVQELRLQSRIEAQLRESGGYAIRRHGKILNVAFTQDRPIDEKSLAPLRGLSDLELLCLENTLLTDQQMTLLQGLNVRMLNLKGTPVTDAGLEHLRGLANLSFLELSNTRVTEEGVARLQRALPRCKIQWVPKDS
ncbi:MAG: hypothetical protein JXB62_14795 [Pirellulales bacterium]|nr:hypothetical protein [Pirellulales bacterium]